MVVLPAENGRRRRPPARPVLKKDVKKLLTTNLTSTDVLARLMLDAMKERASAPVLRA
jgi:hypothetical protein